MAYGFALDENGDLLIENNEISIVTDNDLLKQKTETVLRTNKQEWFFDWEQGINFHNLLGKNTNAELVRYEIEQGLAQVDSTFRITEFAYTADQAQRRASVNFRAVNESGEETGGEITWA